MDNINLTNWPFWAVLAYIVIRDLIPLMVKAGNTFMDKVLPSREKRKEIIEDATIAQRRLADEASIARQKLWDEAAVERESKLDDLQERAIVNQEKTTATLVLIAERQLQHEGRHEAMMASLAAVTAGLASANQALTILLDRVQRGRSTTVTTHKESPL